MEYRKIGQLEVSVIGLGCNNFGRHLSEQETARVVDAGIDNGINLFDTADVYFGVEGSSEDLLGRALTSRRDEVLIATKFGKDQGDIGRGGASPRWIRAAVEDSLRRLRTDRIDLYQLHEPDPETPLEETLGTLDELIAEGKVREIGHSNMSAELIDQADEAARGSATRFVSTQTEWSLVARDCEESIVPAAERNAIAILPFFPLSSGLLTGKYRAGAPYDPSWRLAKITNRDQFIDDERLKVVAALEAFAAERGRTLLELAFGWLLSHTVVASVIAGATRPEQITANAAAGSWHLTNDEMSAVDDILRSGV